MKTKLMVISDWLCAGTGFSEELRHIVYRLAQSGKYEIYWIGINYVGYDMDIPDTLFPDLRHTGATVKSLSGVGPTPLYGLKGFQRNFNKYAPDLVMSMGDPGNFEPYVKEKKKPDGVFFPYMVYTTLDGLPVPSQFREIFRGINVQLAMTEWALLEFQEADVPMGGYIHHGVNWQWMTTNKVEKRKMRKMFGIPDDVTLFISWDTNQYRKRQDALLECWRDFHPESKKAKLFLYTDSDCRLGWNLEEQIKEKGIPRETVLLPEDVYGRRKFWEQAEHPSFHRMVALMGDIYVSTTSGEGFGKCLLEALSLRIPVIVTDYSACPEVCEKGSILVPLYEGPAGYYRIHDRLRRVDGGVVNQEKFTEAMLRLYDNPDEREELGIQGREWAKNFDYDTQVLPAWLNVLGRINPDVILAEDVLRFIK